MSSFNVRIEQIKRLRAAATENRNEEFELRKEAAAGPANAEQLLIQADEANQLRIGWGKLADRLWLAVVPDEHAALTALTPDQRRGNDCFICGGAITYLEPDERLGEVAGHHVFAHIDHKVCGRVLAKAAEQNAAGVTV